MEQNTRIEKRYEQYHLVTDMKFEDKKDYHGWKSSEFRVRSRYTPDNKSKNIAKRIFAYDDHSLSCIIEKEGDVKWKKVMKVTRQGDPIFKHHDIIKEVKNLDSIK